MIFNINRRDYPCIWKAYRNIKSGGKNKKGPFKNEPCIRYEEAIIIFTYNENRYDDFFKYMNNFFLEVKTCFYCLEISVFCIIARVFTWCNIKTVIQTQNKQETHIPKSMKYCVTGTVKAAKWISDFTHFITHKHYTKEQCLIIQTVLFCVMQP